MALPSGYKPLEYITCAGKQWFDTGLSASANLKVEVCVKPASNGLGENAILGASWSASGFFLVFYNNQVKFHSKGASVQTTGFDTTAKSIIQCTQTSLVVNGTSYNLSGGGSDVSTTISLFNVTDAGIGSNNAAMYGDCYYCKMWQGTTLVRNYQPCLNGSSVPGMYDLVNNVFYPSTSGTAFTAGPVANDGRLEYIESSGTQYIDTGFKPNQDTRVVCTFQLASYSAASGIFGQRKGAAEETYLFLYNPGQTAFRSDYNTGNGQTFSVGNVLARYKVDKDQNSTTFNGVTETYPAGDFQATYSMYLFCSNNAGVASWISSMRLYACQIYDNGVLVRDYIPYRYNGEVGLWDRVSNTFYGNSGSGTFTAGPEAVYERVEYIESTGTQYIDTGAIPDYKTGYEIDFQLTTASSSDLTLMGSLSPNICFLGGNSQFQYAYKDGTGYSGSFGASDTNRHIWSLNYMYSLKATLDQESQSLSAMTLSNDKTAFIFATHYNDPNVYGLIQARVFRVKITQDKTIIRDYIPSVRSDGTVGLYDQLNEIFYENAGTGTFVAGPIAKYARVEYLESTGTQYIDALLKPTPNTRVYCAFEMTSAFGSASTGVFGARASAISTSYGLYRTANNTFRSDYYGNIPNITVANDQTKQTVDKNKNVTSFLGGNSAASPVATGSTPYNMLIFSYNNAGNATTFLSSMKLYFMQVYENDILIRDFVPAVRADGTPGLLDRTNNAFYTNSGTGTFVVGPDLDYTKLEYIESTGTQYINTGVTIKPSLSARIDCQLVKYVSDTWFFSTYDTSADYGWRAGVWRNAFFTMDLTPSQTSDINARTVFAGNATKTQNLAIYLLAENRDGSVFGCAYAKLYSCQIYDNGTPVRNYIPALRENGQIGLIDLVSGLFYANAGSGVFIAGPEIVDPDPPEPPGPYEPPSFAEQTLAYLAALRYPFYKLCRLRFLQPDGSTAFSLDNNPKNRRSGAFIADGSISANLQNGKRRNATVTLSNLDSSFDYNVNTVWFGTEIAIDEGLVLPDGSEYYIQQGVFAIENPTEAVEPANRTATYNLVDKWSYLDGTLFGNLESTYEVPVGTNIFQPIEAILAMDRGNGQPVDGVTPIFTEYYNSKTQALPDGSTASLIDSPYTLRIDSDNGTYADVLLGLAAMVNAWIGYDQTGALRIDPSQDDILDTNKPILWQFSMDETTFLGANYTVRNVDVYNDYIVLGELLDDNSQPAGRATNLDPRSDTNVQTIGRKTFRMSAPGFATDKQCQDLAVWKLKRSTSLQKAISISCSQLFHIEENGLVTIVRTDKPGSPVERHLVMGFTRPLTSNGEMQINAVSVQDFVTATVTSWPE